MLFNCFLLSKKQKSILIIINKGSRRPSLTSIHSNNSIRSYSARRYEKEREQKEEREMQRRLARMSSSVNSLGKAPTPSPHSTDDLLPTLEEDKQVKPNTFKSQYLLKKKP